jgi:inorganic triphosphatase YgiF
MATEVEAKFLADGSGPLEQLAVATHLGGAALGAPTTFDEVDRYLDTDDGRLRAAGWACRLRSRGASVRVSAKGPTDSVSNDWLHHRPEVEGPATDSLNPDDWPPSDARALMERLSAGRILGERVRLVQRRTERSVTVDGTPLGTLSLDAVSVQSGERDAGMLFAVELELDADAGDGAGESLAELAAVLAARPGLEADPRTKLEHALAMIAAR